MIKPAALILAVAMGAVSAGTYYGLDLLPEGTIPEPFGRAAQKPEPPKPGAHASAPVSAVAPAAAPAPQPAPAPADQPVTEQDLAEDPAPPAEETVAQAQAAPAPEPVAEPAPAPAPKPQAAPKAESPRTAPALQDEPPPPRPAAKERPKVEVVREDSAAVASAAPAQPAKPRPPDSDVIKPWWPDSSKLPANQLKLQYAGQVQGEQAIALLFSAPLNVDSLRQHAQVKTAAGAAVKGAWELGKNPRLAVFRGVDQGRYTVILSPQVADTKGFMLGQTLKGPVYIQPP